MDGGGRIDPEAAAAVLPFDSISLERQACFGSCPVYTVGFGRDRRAVLRGTRFLEQTGPWKGHVGTHDMGRLSFMVERFDILDLDPLYTAHTTDGRRLRCTSEGVERVRPCGSTTKEGSARPSSSP